MSVIYVYALSKLNRTQVFKIRIRFNFNFPVPFISHRNTNFYTNV